VPDLPSSLNATAMNVTLPSTIDMQTGVLLPNPDTPTCEVGVSYVLVNASVALQDRAQPTSSPVPSLVMGELKLQLATLQSEDVKVRMLT